MRYDANVGLSLGLGELNLSVSLILLFKRRVFQRAMRFSVDGTVMEVTPDSAVIVFFFFFHNFVPDSSDFILDAGGSSGIVFAGSGGLFDVGCYFEFNHVSNLFFHCVFLIVLIEGRPVFFKRFDLPHLHARRFKS